MNTNFEEICDHNNYSIIISLLFSILCFARYIIYFMKRVDSMKKSNNENVLIGVDYI